MIDPNLSHLFSLMESLEERVLFDGVPDAGFLVLAQDASEVPQDVQRIEQADFSGPRVLVLVDAGVANSQQLLASIIESKPDSALEIRIIEPDTDGIVQVTEILANAEHDYDAVHLISHGSEGQVQFGSATLSTGNISSHANQIASWSDALSDDADLLFYGCNLAGNAEGESFIETLSALTGADVAASDDLTGASNLGGDWVLEFSTGVIDSALYFSVDAMSEWQGLLATDTTFTAGSVIIDMGQDVQTAGNALKPYGLIYDLLINEQTPINWAIEDGKVKDGVDFTVDGKDYKGGSFIIDAGLITDDVQTILDNWAAQGVVLDTITHDFVAPIYEEITGFAKIVFDEDNGGIAANYLSNAGIPDAVDISEATEDDPFVIGTPLDLNSCYDMYVMPHADPHRWDPLLQTALLNHVEAGGWLWQACHSVSAVENVDIDGDGNLDMNFLSNNGLQWWGDHDDGTLDYTFNPDAADDWATQYIGVIDGGQQNGSESIYVPNAEGWRDSTTIAVYDSDHPDQLGGPNSVAASLVYGRAFGDEDYGMVMYEGGHSHSGSGEGQIAAQRAFLNMLLQVSTEKSPDVSATLDIAAGEFSAVATGGSGIYTYEWVATDGVSTFSMASGSALEGETITTDFTLNSDETVVKLVITDSCGRQSIFAEGIRDEAPILDHDGDNSSGVAGANYQGYFKAAGVPIPVVDSDVSITDDATTTVDSAVIDFVVNPDSESLSIDTTLATSYGITVTPDGSGGFTLVGTATIEQYQEVLTTLTYQSTSSTPDPTDRVIEITIDNGKTSNTAQSILKLDLPPAPLDDVYQCLRGNTTNISAAEGVLANDVDNEGPLTITAYNAATTQGGTVVLNANGSFDYTPAGGFFGHDTFTYTVRDEGGDEVTATVHLYVNATGNSAPVARWDGMYVVDSTGTLNVDATRGLLSNDSDPDTDPITIDAFDATSANGGTVTVNPDGSFEYTPHYSFVGFDTFTYSIGDGQGGVAQATVTIEVRNVGPTANDVSGLEAPGGFQITFERLDLVGNDTDPEGQLLSIVAVSGTTEQGGTAILRNDGTVDYTGPTGYTGIDTFTYTIEDEYGARSSATVTVEVFAAPVANQDGAATDVNTPVTIDILANDKGLNLDPSSVTITVDPDKGSATVNPDGTITFDPEGEDGEFFFEYEVSDQFGATATGQAQVAVAKVGEAAAGWDYATTPEGISVTINVLDNDYTPSSGWDFSTLEIRTDPDFGIATVNLDGTITYTPNGGFQGIDTLEYRIDDNDGERTNEATVVIRVTAPSSNNPTANDDYSGTDEDWVVVIDVLDNDMAVGAPLDPATVEIVSPPSDGFATVNLDGTISYDPDGNDGVYTFTYKVSDTDGNPSSTATATVVVAKADEPAGVYDDLGEIEKNTNIVVDIADLLANDYSELASPGWNNFEIRGNDNGTAVFTDTSGGAGTSGFVTFTPDMDYVGPATFEYRAEDADGNRMDDTLVFIEVVEEGGGGGSGTSQTVSYAAEDQNFIHADDTGIRTGNVLDNDFDVDGDPFEVVEVDGVAVPSGGSIVLNGLYGELTIWSDGSYSYDVDETSAVLTALAANETLVESFNYTIDDGMGGGGCCPNCGGGGCFLCNADLIIKIVGVDDLPVAVDDVYNSPADTQLIGNVVTDDTGLGPDQHAEGPVTAKLETGPSNGTLIFNADGSFIYTPGDGFGGTDTFTYSISDECNTSFATVTINIMEPPVAVDDVATTGPDTNVIIDVTANDSDADGTIDPTTVTLLDPLTGLPAAGNTVTVPGEGTYTVNPVTGEVTFDPEPGFSGATTPIQYIVADDDGQFSQPAFIGIVVGSAPITIADTAEAAPDETVVFDVLANDSDLDGTLDPTTVTLLDPVTGDPVPGNTLTIPGEGTFTVDPVTGEVTFDPVPGFAGTVTTVQYAVTDNDGNVSNPTDINITVQSPPEGTDDMGVTQPGQAVTVSVTSNDMDPDGVIDPTSVTLLDPVTGLPAVGNTVTIPGEGTYTVDPATGDITFAPEPGFMLDTSSVHYIVADNDGNYSEPIKLIISVGGVPLAFDDSAETAPDANVTINVTANDVDPDDFIDPTTVTLIDPSTGLPAVGNTITIAGEGTYTVDPVTGAITFDPESGFYGTTTDITYTVEDTNGNTSNEATLSVYVQAPPVANDDSTTTLIDTPVTINPLINDTDPDNPLDPTSVTLLDPLTGAPVGGTLVIPGQGTWTVDPVTGEITFTPQSGFTGAVTPIRYTVDDMTGNTSNSGTIDLIVQAPPVAEDNLAFTPQDTNVTVNVALNDTDIDGTVDPTTVTLIDPVTGLPAAGNTVTIAGTGTFTVDPVTGEVTFDPEPDFIGTAAVEYTITDNDGLVSEPADILVSVGGTPIAVDDNETTLQDTDVTISVIGNDSDFDGTLDPTTVTLLDPDTGLPAVGNTVTIAGEGTYTVDPVTGDITFDPDPTFVGEATPIQYTVADDDGLVSNPAELTITVEAPPVAADDSYTASPDQTLFLNVIANDADVDSALDPTSVTLIDPNTGLPAVGNSVTIAGEGTYTVHPLTGVITFDPDPDFAGVSTVQYTVSDVDGNISNTATINVTVEAPPEATDNITTTLENTPVTIDVAADDTDADGIVDPTTVTLLDPISGLPAAGNTVTIIGEGTYTVNPTTGEVTFTPEPGYVGTSTVQYIVADDDGNFSDPATILVSVGGAPIAIDDTDTMQSADPPLVINPLANDSDPDGTLDPTTVMLIDPVTGLPVTTLTIDGEGTYVVDSVTGEITFTQDTSFVGVTTPVMYTVADDEGSISNEASITITVKGPPTATNNEYNTPENEAVAGNFITDDTGEEADQDADGDSLTLNGAWDSGGNSIPTDGTQVTLPSGALLTIYPDGSYVYDPNGQFNDLPYGTEATDSFTYEIVDDDGNSSMATVTIVLQGENDGPTATDNTASVTEDSALSDSGNVILDNDGSGIDSDPDTGDVLTITEVNGTAVPADPGTPLVLVGTYGTLTIASDGTYTYDLDNTNPTVQSLGTGEQLIENFDYLLSDLQGATDTGTLIITIDGVNDPPVISLDSDNSLGGANDGNNEVIFTEGNAPVAISDTDVTITDPDDTAMETFTITVGGVVDGSSEIISFNGTDVDLSMSLGSPITVTIGGTTFNIAYDGTTFDITNDAGGAMPVADIELLLAATTYLNVSENPTAGDRTLNIVVNDGEMDSNTATSTITVVPVNDPPQVDLNGSGAGFDYSNTFTEAAGPVSLADAANDISDLDDTTLPYLTIDVDESTILDAGREFLTFGGTDFLLDAAADSTMTVNIGGTDYDVTFTAATSTLTIVRNDGNEMTIAEAEAILADATYNNTSPYPTEGDRVFEVSTNDGDNDSNIATSTISVFRDMAESEWSITGGSTVDEGASVSYTVTLDNALLQAGETATIELSFAAGATAAGDFDADFDTAVTNAIAAYTGPGSLSWDGTTLTFVSDGTGPMGNLDIVMDATDDLLNEGPEIYMISLANPDSATGETITLGNDSVATTINDNDQSVWSIMGDTTVDEGSTAQYTVALSGELQAGEEASIDLTFGSGDTNSGDFTEAFSDAVTQAIADYVGPGSFNWDGTTLTFVSDGTGPMGDLVIDIVTDDDALSEGAEAYNVDLANPSSSSGADITLGNDSVATTINDNDQSVWSIMGDTSVDEGGTAQYTVALSGELQAGEEASIDLTFGSGDTSSGDFTQAFSDAVTQAIADYVGPGSFVWDGTTLTFVSDGTGPMGDLVIDVVTDDDALNEGPEAYTVDLANPGSTTGADIALGNDSVATTITDNDQSVWSITGDTTVNEGSTAQYTMALSGEIQAGEEANIDLTFGSGDTSSGDFTEAFTDAVTQAIADYVGSGSFVWDGTTLTFVSDGTGPMGDLVIDVVTDDDALNEGPEAYSVDLANPSSTSGADVTLGNDSVATTINDNDQSVWSIMGDTTVDEGSTAQYTVALSGELQAGEEASIDLAFGSGDTSSGDFTQAFSDAVTQAIADYVGPGSFVWDGTTLTFVGDGTGPMGDLVIDVETANDTLTESSESFTVDLANPGSTTGADIALGNDSLATTITDNDQSVWSIMGDVAPNEGDTAQYTVALSGILQAGETATVNLSINDDTTDAADYADFVDAVNAAIGIRTDVTFDETTGLLTYTSDGNPMQNLLIELDIVDDVLTEGPEAFSVNLDTPGSTTGADVALGNDEVISTIVDDETSAWSIAGDVVIDEGSAATYVVSLSGTLNVGGTATIELSLTDLTTDSGDYADFVDAINAAIGTRTDLVFDPVTGLLTYTSIGTPMENLVISLDALDDSFAEGPESYSLALANPDSTTGAVVDLGNDSVTTVINDNDQPVWSITGDTSVNEGSTAQYTVALSGTLQPGEEAAISLTLGEVDTNSADYADFVDAVNAAIGTRNDVTFDPVTGLLTYTSDGNPMQDLVIDIATVNDSLTEGNENFSLNLANPTSSTGVNVALGNASVTTVINDNDQSVWSISGDTTVNEGTAAQYTIELSGAIQDGEIATIELTLGDIDTNSADYTALVNAVNAAIGTRTDLVFVESTGLLSYTGDGSPMEALVISLTAVDDSLSEGPESYTVDLANPASSTDAVTLGNDSVMTTINDNDGSVWSIMGDATVDEGSAAQYTVALSGTLQAGQRASIELSLSDIETTNADYDAFVAAINAAIGSRTDVVFVEESGVLSYTSDGSPMQDLVIDLIAIDDLLSEGDESYTIDLVNPASTTGADIALGNDMVTTIINDNDQSTWSITGDTTVDEGNSAQYTVALSGILQVGETATIDLAFNQIETDSADYAAFVDAVTTAIGTRTDVVFDSVSGTLTYTGDGNPMEDLVIDFTTVDDALTEGPESFSVSLADPGSTTGADIDLGNDTVTTVINDDDQSVWSIAGTMAPDEGETAQYTVALSGTLQAGETATINLSFNDVTTDSADYADFVAAVNAAIALRADVTFDSATGLLTYTGDGSLMADLVINLVIVDDVFIEGPESFTVALDTPGSTTGADVTLGNDRVVTTIINDDEISSWSIDGDISVNEGSTAQYTIGLSGTLGAGETAFITLTFDELTTDSADHADFIDAVNAAIGTRTDIVFDSASGLLTYTSVGTPMADLVINLATNDDVIGEGAELYSVDLASPGSGTGADIRLGNDSVTTVINDNDNPFWSIIGDTSVNEGDTATYTVMLSGTLQVGEETTVRLTLGEIDTNSDDYASFVDAVNTAIGTRTDVAFDGVTGELTYIGDGLPMENLVINLTTSNDVLNEGVEVYSLELADPTSSSGVDVSLGNDSVSTLINDDDQSAWSIMGDATVDEGNTGTYTVALSGELQAGETATIDLTLTSGDTASIDFADAFNDAVSDAIAAYSGPGSFNWDGSTLEFVSDGTGEMQDLVINLAIENDVLTEGPESYSVGLANPDSTTGANINLGNNTVTTVISDDEQSVWTIMGDSAVDEGLTAQYTVSLSGTMQYGETATIELTTGVGDTNSADFSDAFGDAVTQAIADYTGPGSFNWDGTTLQFNSDGTGPMGDLVINVATDNDTLTEGAESYTLNLANPASTTGADVALDNNSVTTTINDDEQSVWSITGDTSVDEGSSAQHIVALSGTLQAGEVASIELSISNVDTSSADYTSFVTAVNDAIGTRTDIVFDSVTGLLTYTGDGTPMDDLVINLATVDDIMTEGAENYTIDLANPASTTGADVALGADTMTTTIVDDEEAVWSIIGDLSVNEGATAEYTVALSGTFKSGESVTVDLSLNDVDTNSGDYGDLMAAIQDAVDANPDVSFDPTTGTLTYVASSEGASMTPLVIVLSIEIDTLVEATETFELALTNATSSTGVMTAVDPVAGNVITGINGPPVAEQDINNTLVDTPVTGNVLTNDLELNGDAFEVINVNGVPIGAPIATSNGIVEMNPDGTYTYTPDAGYTGTDSFTYEICDEFGNCDTTTVTIEIRDTNTDPSAAAPIANNDHALTFVNQPVEGSLTSNDGDPTRQMISINTTPVTPPANGTVVINPDGTYVYIPNPGFTGFDTFVYEITDTDGNTAQASMTIWITADANGTANDQPFGDTDAGITTKNVPVSGNLLANDTDPNGDPLTINVTPVTPPLHGTLRINPDGTYFYEPEPGFVGNDSFVYQVCDASGECDVVTVQISVFNQPPVPQDDQVTISNLRPFTGAAFANDSDPDGDDLSGLVTVRPLFGTLAWNRDGTYTYTPGPDFTGTDSFEYEVCDTSGVCRTATVTITMSTSSDTAGGYPPVFPIIGPSNFARISDAIEFYGNGPEGLYGGVPINTNAHPLELDSGLPVAGGYDILDQIAEGECERGEVVEQSCIPCETPVDACENVFDASGDVISSEASSEVEEAPTDDVESVPDSELMVPGSSDIHEGAELELEGTQDVQQEVTQSEVERIDERVDDRVVSKPSFLKRFKNWIVG